MHCNILRDIHLSSPNLATDCQVVNKPLITLATYTLSWMPTICKVSTSFNPSRVTHKLSLCLSMEVALNIVHLLEIYVHVAYIASHSQGTMTIVNTLQQLRTHMPHYLCKHCIHLQTLPEGLPRSPNGINFHRIDPPGNRDSHGKQSRLMLAPS